MTHPLHSAVWDEYQKLCVVVLAVPNEMRLMKMLEGTAGLVSVADLVAYQIGYGKCLVRRYEDGCRGISPEMPGVVVLPVGPCFS